MPPRRKSRRLNEPQALQAPAIQFVPDPVPDPPAPSTSGGQNHDALVSAIVQAVQAAVAPQVSTTSPSTSSTRGDVVQSVVQDEVAAISGVEVGTGSQPESPLFHSVTVPLGGRVSAKLKSKIWADEFVDMGAMLNTSTTQDKYSLSVTAPNPGVSTKTANFMFEPVQGNKKVSSIHEWITAFHTFAAIYLTKFSVEAPNVLKYCETVRDIATRGGDWLYYDEQFRSLRQSAPKQYPWNAVHWELWHRSVTFRAKQPVQQSDRSNTKSRGKSPFVKGVCWTYNSGRFCSGCRFEHKCSKCGGKHQSVQCQSGQNGQQPLDNRTASASTNAKLSAGNTRKGFST